MKTILFIHAISGGISLISGLIAIVAKKGRKLHLKSGLIYYRGMMLVVISGLILGFYRSNTFILTVAVFSFYMVFTGRRILSSKKEVNPKFIDWFFNILSLAIASFMLYLAIINFIRVGFSGSVPMLFVFGGLLFWMVIEDLIVMKNRVFKKGAFLITHISRMGGSYIATSTAFLVINVDFNPQWIVWLLPTAIGTPMITMATRNWKKRFNPKVV